ncbi:MAG: LysR family transcriptional regulator [Pseudomonadota bacterium]
MTLEQLNAFNSVVKYGSVRAAGEKLNKTPSSISIALKTLEDSLGMTLFCRQGHRLTLSNEGLEIYGRVQHILENVNEVKEYVSDTKHPRKHQLTVSNCEDMPPELKHRLKQVIDDEFPAFTLNYSDSR